jgi:hypothetical protein
MNNLAMILVGRGDSAAAEPLAADAVAHDHPRRANFFDTLATVCTQLTKWKDAVEAIEMASRLNPNDVVSTCSSNDGTFRQQSGIGPVRS